MTKRTQRLGNDGENIAAAYLQKNNYNILARNFRFGRNAEIDIIAEIENTIIFVEVKTRSSNKFGMPAEAVTLQKQQKIFMAATKFIQENELFDRACRFDVIEVFANNKEKYLGWKVNHIKSAFEINNV